MPASDAYTSERDTSGTVATLHGVEKHTLLGCGDGMKTLSSPQIMTQVMQLLT